MLVINTRFLTQEITGVQRFAIELSKQLKKIFKSELIFVSPHNIIHKELAKELGVEIIGKRTGHLWEQLDLPKYLKANKKPLLLNLCNTAPIFYKNKLVTIHDIAFERFPETFDWRFRLVYKNIIPIIIKNSLHTFTVSNFSRTEITNFYKIEKEKITVIYNAVNHMSYLQYKSIEEDYILAVSSLNYQKNFHSLIKAFNQIDNKKIKLYLVGGINKSFADTTLLKDIQKNQNIIFKGRVSDDELERLYASAKCFVYPSLYEGFGIPPLEAQICGCPVVCSNVASLPEVCGDSVLYCDPYKVEDIKEKVEQIINSKTLQQALIKKGFENVSKFSWENSALKVVKKMNEIK